jgi:hypothetical protein
MLFSPMRPNWLQTGWAQQTLETMANRHPSKGIRCSLRNMPPRPAAAAGLAKWHGIQKGEGLGRAELAHMTDVIERWLRTEFADAPEKPAQGRLL